MSLFRRLILVAGIPLGIVVAFATAARPTRVWPDVVLTGAGAAVVFAAALTATATPFVRRVRRTRWTAILFSVAMLGVGVVGGVATFVVSQWLPHGRWVRLPSVPEPVREFAGPPCYDLADRDGPAVIVRARSGRLYVRLRSGETDSTWQPADSAVLTLRNGRPCRRRSGRPGPTPLPPGPVVARQSVDVRGVDCGGREHYLLLQDGSVWQWGVGGCALIAVMEISLVLVAALAGALAASTAVLRSKPPVGWPAAAGA